MAILICPGIHPAVETDDFLSGLMQADHNLNSQELWVYPAADQPAYSGLHVFKFLGDRTQQLHSQTTHEDSSDWVRQAQPLSLICFSAGVVGALGAALAWHALGGVVQTFIAIDGWGVPLFTPFPTYRLSHDEFTHRSCLVMGGGHAGFWAEPAVDHRQLWRSPHTTHGQVERHSYRWGFPAPRASMTAAQFIRECLMNKP
jgi:hypothetical protein